MSAPTYDDARARIAADLAADERAYPGRSFMLIYRDDLRTLLAAYADAARDRDEMREAVRKAVRDALLYFGAHDLHTTAEYQKAADALAARTGEAR